MRLRSLAAAIAVSSVCAVTPAYADTAGLTITSDALESLADGELSVQPLGSTDLVGPASFSLPVSRVTFTSRGAVKAIRLSGGLSITDSPASMDLTKIRVNVPAQVASVRTSSTTSRVRAFDLVRVRVTDKKVRGVLLIAPGAASVLNAEFDTYVFSDGLRFARFVYPR